MTMITVSEFLYWSCFTNKFLKYSPDSFLKIVCMFTMKLIDIMISFDFAICDIQLMETADIATMLNMSATMADALVLHITWKTVEREPRKFPRVQILF